MIIYDETVAHCSSHSSFASGCGDCAVSHLFQITHETKLTKVARVDIHQLEINPGRPDPKIQIVRNQLTRKLYIFLTNAAHDVIKAVEKKFDELEKASEITLIIEALAVAAFFAIDWISLVKDIANDLSIAMHAASLDGLSQLEIKGETEYDKVATLADDYSKSRAAEMVGKRWAGDELIENSNAKFSIAATTRDDLRDTIEAGINKNLSVDELKKQIQSLGTFSKARAELIAKTEIAMAQFRGIFDVWKRSGVVKSVSVILSHNHSTEDICDEVSEGGAYHINHAPTLPLHPRCECSMVVTELYE